MRACLISPTGFHREVGKLTSVPKFLDLVPPNFNYRRGGGGSSVCLNGKVLVRERKLAAETLYSETVVFPEISPRGTFVWESKIRRVQFEDNCARKFKDETHL